MEEHQVRIIDIEPLTHNVKRFRVEKPENYSFIPGQATEVSIASPNWREEKRPFTFTSLNTDPYLEFTIKIYSDHNGVTHELGKLIPGDALIIRDVWGAISYKGKGTFIAGGAGITPFIAIFRDLHNRHELEGNQLIFANRTNADIILEQELNLMLGNAFINILSDENIACRYYGLVDDIFLKRHVEHHDSNFYICGPPPMVDMVLNHLDILGYSKDLVTIELQKMPGNTIWTIGHSTHMFGDFTAMLKSCDIECVTDIRSLPGSRHYPQFNKENLGIALPQAGIRYIHLPGLGGRRKVKPGSKNTAWRLDAFRGYADYMETPEFKSAIDQLVNIARNERTAYMCAESLWWRCHRSLVSDYLKWKGWNVLHIMGIAKTTKHTYTQPAKIVDGKINYEL